MGQNAALGASFHKIQDLNFGTLLATSRGGCIILTNEKQENEITNPLCKGLLRLEGEPSVLSAMFQGEQRSITSTTPITTAWMMRIRYA